MDSRPTPSTAIVGLLARLTSREAAEALVGDGEEALARHQAAKGSVRWPRLWLNRRLTLDAAALLWHSSRRLIRAERHTFRDAWRSLRSTPGTSLFALLILTAGMAGATVTYSVVDAVILRPFPFGRGRDLVMVSGGALPTVSAMEFQAWRDGVSAFDSLAAYRGDAEILPIGSSAILVPSARTTASLFEVLRVRPLIGQTFTAADEMAGKERVVVISYALWQRLFNGDAAIIGRRVPFKAGAATVVGVMPPGFTFPIMPSDQTTEVWTPYVVPDRERAETAHGVVRYLLVIGRLRAGATRELASSQIVASMTRVVRDHKYAFDHWQPSVVPIDEAWFGPVRMWMLLVLAAVGLVMLLACVNVANLLLIRSAGRTRDLAVRAALGASRRQIVGALLTESVLLSCAAAALGLLFSAWGVRVARASLPAGILRASTIAIDARVLAAVIAATLVTGVGFGVVPAWQASRTDVLTLLKDAAPTTTRARGRWRSTFLIVEIAVVGVLLVATTLFVSSFVQVVRADLGFARKNLVVLGPVFGYRGEAVDVAKALGRLPGVDAVATLQGGSAPLVAAAFDGGSAQSVLTRPDRPDVRLTAEFRRVSSDYFRTADIPISRGRVFDDRTEADTGVVIDEAAARVLFPDREAVGATVTLGSDGSRLTVVGVVATVKLGGPETAGRPNMYLPYTRLNKSMQFMVRTTRPAASMTSALVSAISAFMPPSAHVRVVLIDDAFAKLTADRRFNAGVLGLFGVVAVLIGAAGIYSAMAAVVAQQHRELAVRVALGATPARLRRALVAETARHVAVGLAIGLPAAWWLSRFVAALLFEVQPRQVWPYAIVVSAVAVVGLIASLVPARRAGRIDPIAALKN